MDNVSDVFELIDKVGVMVTVMHGAKQIRHAQFLEAVWWLMQDYFDKRTLSFTPSSSVSSDSTKLPVSSFKETLQEEV